MEIDAMLLGSLTVLASFFCMIIFFVVKVLRTDGTTVNRDDILREIQANAAAPQRQRGPVVVGGRRRAANTVRNRTTVARAADDDFVDEDASNDDMMDDDEMTGADGSRIGKKKLAKLEAKADKKAQREYELAERDDKRRAKLEQEQEERETRDKETVEEKEREEVERLARELKEKEEYEEYLKMKESFAVDASGFDAAATAEGEANMRASFVEHIKRAKCVNMDELGSAFSMKSSAVVARVQALLADGAIQGVIDDRGKFIYISDEELDAVAKFINQRGRVSMVELAAHSNSLVSMKADTTTATVS